MRGVALILMLFLLPMLQGCVAVVAGGAGAVGYAAAQERSLGNAVDDTTIYSQINSYFIQEHVNNLFNRVGIEVNEGRVLLTGKVREKSHRVEAVRLAWQPRGVIEVINEIEVSDRDITPQELAQDAWISAQVKTKLLFGKGVSSINYNVEVAAGTVYLIGVAKSQQELSTALEIASKVKGVKKVVSHMRLRDAPERH